MTTIVAYKLFINIPQFLFIFILSVLLDDLWSFFFLVVVALSVWSVCVCEKEKEKGRVLVKYIASHTHSHTKMLLNYVRNFPAYFDYIFCCFSHEYFNFLFWHFVFSFFIVFVMLTLLFAYFRKFSWSINSMLFTLLGARLLIERTME